MRVSLFLICLIATLCLGTWAVAQESQDEVDPRLIRPFWLGTPFQLRSSYIFAPSEQTKFGGSFGIDLSHYSVDLDRDPACKTQSEYDTPKCSCSVDWNTMATFPLVYVMTKASDGAGRDLSFGKIWTELEPLHETGKLYRGAYHFLRPGISAETQADTFLAALDDFGGRTSQQLSPIVDIEWSNRRVVPGTNEFKACPKTRLTKDSTGRYFCDMWYTMSSEQIVDLAQRWIAKVSRETGKPVMVYTNSRAWWDQVLGVDGKKLAQEQAIWNSRYNNSGPVYDKKWTAQGGSPKWSMPPLPHGSAYGDEYNVGHYWQFSENGSLPGPVFICSGKKKSKDVDMNWFPLVRTDYERLFDLKD